MCPLGFKFRRNFHSVVLSQDSRHHLDMCVMHTHCSAPNTPPIPALPSTLLCPFVRQSVNFTSVGRSQHFFRRQCTNWDLYGLWTTNDLRDGQFAVWTDPCLTIVTSWSQWHVLMPIKSSEPWQDSERRETLVRLRYNSVKLLSISRDYITCSRLSGGPWH